MYIGKRNTEQRKNIYRILEEAKTPMSAGMIHAALKEQGRTMDKSTVYRTLAFFTERGLVRKLCVNEHNEGLYARTAAAFDHLFTCTGCQKTVRVNLCPLLNIQKEFERHTGYMITGHQLSLFGMCESCKQKQPEHSST